MFADISEMHKFTYNFTMDFAAARDMFAAIWVALWANSDNIFGNVDQVL